MPRNVLENPMANSTGSRKWFYPLDRTAWIMILLLSLAIGFFVIKGDRSAPRIRDFTWQNRQVGTEDAAFMLTFSRPMDHASVENNLQIKPVLPGKTSWAGRRMAYTLDAPAPYGETFELSLQGARDRFSKADDVRAQMSLYTGQFKTRDRAFVYLGVEGDEAGRLVMQNLTRQQKQVLTPPNLTVMDFKPYPEGDRLLFSASDRTDPKALINQKIYTVTTGIALKPAASQPGEKKPILSSAAPAEATPGVINLVLDNTDYQNLKFDLSPNGKIIIVQRINQKNPADSGIWMVKEGETAQPIKTEPGGDFLIAPDSTSLAMSQGQGMAILPLEPDGQRLDFLPKFGVVLSFARDGSAAAMVKFNRDPANPTRSLFIVSNQGVEKELLKTDGNILSAEFDPTKKNLYCLVTKRLPGKDYVEEPYLIAINLKTAKRSDLLKLPIQRDIQMSLAPDGLGILFDQVLDQPDKKGEKPAGQIRGSDGKAIESSRLWFFPIVLDEANMTQPADPQALELPGLRPRWLP
jgi:hypothetical protein